MKDQAEQNNSLHTHQATLQEQVRKEVMTIAKYTLAYAANFYGTSGPRTPVQEVAFNYVLGVIRELTYDNEKLKVPITEQDTP